MDETSLSYRNGLLEDLKDPREAATYLNAALEKPFIPKALFTFFPLFASSFFIFFNEIFCCRFAYDFSN
jgi:hypothetical protein